MTQVILAVRPILPCSRGDADRSGHVAFGGGSGSP